MSSPLRNSPALGSWPLPMAPQYRGEPRIGAAAAAAALAAATNLSTAAGAAADLVSRRDAASPGKNLNFPAKKMIRSLYYWHLQISGNHEARNSFEDEKTNIYERVRFYRFCDVAETFVL